MVSAGALAILLVIGPSSGGVIAQRLSASPDGDESKQQERLASCEADATAANITGDARKSVISICLNRKAVATTATRRSKS
jgi:hypothetical protein